MQILGKWHSLKVEEIDRDFVYLNHPENLMEQIEVKIKNEITSEEEIEIKEQPVLIPMAHNQTSQLLKEGQEVNVFLYNKKEGDVAATMLKPRLELNQFAYLRFVGANSVAYFADIGLDADLFIFRREDGLQPEIGKKYIVSMRLDRVTGKLNGEINLEKLLDREGYNYKQGEEVNCQILGKTDGGFKINVDEKYWGYLKHEDTVSHTKIGSRFKGYVVNPRSGSLIVSMQASGESSVKEASHKLLMLVQEKKYLRLTEESDDEEIKLRLKMNKPMFKKALNELSSKNLVTTTKRGIKIKKT